MTTSILMIEDDERLANMVTEYLAQSGFVVQHAPNAERGLQILQNPDKAALPELVHSSFVL